MILQEWQWYPKKPWYSKFLYFNKTSDEAYGYWWYDFIIAIGPLQMRWRGKPHRIIQ